ncbi:MAG TPA: dihydrodipicolinate synthase family protein [Candidatus Eisenbacteria bacterium]|nr:dihydrodipicolinate synthase family protein [Candidatus Eisenbacteria bacterium]
MDYLPSEAKQAARERFTGLWAAITTPFSATGELDEAALRRDLDRLTGELRVDGVFCGGVMGEFWALSGAERRRLVEVVVECCRGKCPVLAHTGHHSAAETIELTRHAAGAGADFAVVINPYYPPATDEGIYRWFEQVCAGAGIGIWLFDNGYSGVALSTSLIRRLATIENVCGIKVGRPHDRYLELLAAVGDTILVCSPHEETWLENMRDHGQRVYMSSAAPYLYQTPGWQPMREYTTLALGGDIAGAEKAAATLDPVRAVAGKWLRGRPRQIDSIISIKAWAGLVGMSGGAVRPPLVSHTRAELDDLAADLAAAGLRPTG